MSWFGVLKRIDLQQDWTVAPERTDFQPSAPVPTPPQRQATKIIRRQKAVKEQAPLEIKDEDLDCPTGTLWCEKHEECEPEKEWHTHNAHPTKEDIQWGGGAKGPALPKQQAAQKEKTR